MKYLMIGLLTWASSAFGEEVTDAQVLFLGEVHDNPAHHARQAEIVDEVQPRAIVWEMLSPAEAEAVTPERLGDEAGLHDALGWADSGWPDFSMYYPIFTAAPGSAHYGAELSRQDAGKVISEGRQGDYGLPDAFRAALQAELPRGQQEQRQAMQKAAHCDALPDEMLPGMVDVQRVRDALLAATALKALNETGGPVVVITGNGHARTDWGAPALLAQVAPEVGIYALGQGEDGNTAPDGGFDVVESAPPVDRGDPCAAFAN